MLERISGWIAHHPLPVLGGILVLTLFFGAFAPRIQFLTDMEKMLPQDDPVVNLFERTKDTFGSQSMILIGIEAPPGKSLFNLDSLRKIYQLTRDLEALEKEKLLEDVISPTNADVVEGTELAIVVRPAMPKPPETQEDVEIFKKRILGERQFVGFLVLKDGSAFSIVLKVHPQAEANQLKIDRLMEEVNAILSRYQGPERFYVTGDAAFMYYMNHYMHQDLRVLLPIVILVVLAVLFLSFRTIRGTLLPLVVVLIAVIWTVGLMALCGAKFTMISTILPVLLVAVGSAYGIHIVNHYYERLGEEERHREAVSQVVREMANPVFIAALTTAAGFITLMTAFLKPIREFGLFAAAGVMFSFVISLTLIPAVFSLTRSPKAPRSGAGRPGPIAAASRWLAPRLDRRGGLVVLIVAALVFGFFLSQVPHLKVESNMSKYFRRSSPVIQGMDFVESHFGGSLQMSVVVDTGKRDGIKDPAVLRFMDSLQEYLKSMQLVGHASSLVDLVKETNYTLHGDDERFYTVPDSARAIAQELLLYEMGGGEILKSMATRDFSKAQITITVRSVGTSELERLARRTEDFIAKHAPAGVRAYITGAIMVYIQFSHKLVHSQIVSLFTSFGAVWIIVALLMGSMVAGLFSLVPLALSVVGNFGTMALAGAKLDMATVMIASIVVGIGVDYAVHFITRYRRERLRGLGHVGALERTYDTAGRAILYNALTLALGFLVLVFSSFGALQTLGWLVAMTMVTSSLGALFIIPAVFGSVQPGFLSRQPSLARVRRMLRPRGAAADPERGKKERR